MKLLVTGATGKLGSMVLDYLLEKVPAGDIAVSVRDPEKAAALKAKGVEVRKGDFADPESLVETFSGIDRLLIISIDGDNETRIRLHSNAVAAAEKAKVKFIAYTSVANATESTVSLAEVHRATEAAIKNTGIPYAFLRNNWYLENEVGSIQAILAGAPLVVSAGDGKVGWALKKEYAEAAATVLAQGGHENTVYELSSKPISYDDLAIAIGTVIGKPVQVQQVDDETYTNIMRGAGVPEFLLPMVVGIQKGVRDGALDVESNDFVKVLGHELTPITEAVAFLMEGINQQA